MIELPTNEVGKQTKELGARINILGVYVMPMTLGRAVDMLEHWRKARQQNYVCCVSVHGLVTAQRDPLVRQAISHSGLATQDGMPLVWWSRLSGVKGVGRVCGPDLMEAMMAVSVERGYRHYFYGGNQNVVQDLIANLRSRYVGITIAGHRSPPFRVLTDTEDNDDVLAINATSSDFVWVGLGMPKQEKWMATHVGRIHATALLGVGAAFDFHAGSKRRAPGWMQRTGLEWIFRLASEPRRLGRRYCVDNAIFLAYCLQQLAGLKRFAQEK